MGEMLASVDPEREIFDRPLVQYVLAAIEFSADLRLGLHEQVFDGIRAQFGDRVVSFGPGFRVNDDDEEEHVLFAIDGAGDSCAVFRSALYVETVRYGRFERFQDLVDRCWSVLAAVAPIEIAGVTLRYVDELRVANATTAGDYQRFVNIPLAPTGGALSGQVTRSYGGWTFGSDAGVTVDLGWTLTATPAIRPSHPLSRAYVPPDGEVLALDWSSHVARDGDGGLLLREAMTSAYGVIKSCFEATITDECRELMRGEAK